MHALRLSDLALASDPGLPAFFLGRLSSLVARRAAAVNPAERQALSMALFSIYLDCCDLGLGAEARAIVGRLRGEAGVGEAESGDPVAA